MVHEFITTRRVEFADTDVAGIVHFSNFFRYLESAEHEFFRSLGLELYGERDGRMFGWARVHASCDYARPAHYADLLQIHLTVRGKTENALRYTGVVSRLESGRRAHLSALGDAEPAGEGSAGDERGAPRCLAEGKLEVVYVERGADDARMRATPMPAAVAEHVTVAP